MAGGPTGLFTQPRLTWATRWLLKPVVFALCLAPALRLTAGAFEVGGLSLGADPVKVMLHTCGRWTLNFLMMTLCLTPLRDLTHSVFWLRFGACSACSPSFTSCCTSACI